VFAPSPRPDDWDTKETVIEHVPTPHKVAPAPPPVLQAPLPALRRKGSVVVVFGCRGGAGSTTLAVNMAGAFVRQGKRTCLIDLDLQLGDVFVALDLEPSTSLATLARDAESIDDAALLRRLMRHDSGLYALTQVGRPWEIDPALAERMPALLSCLQDRFDAVVVDGVRDFGDPALAALDMADRIVLVVTQDVPAVRRATRVAELLQKLGYSDRRVHIVLNRTQTRSQVSEGESERALSLPIAARVRNDFRRISAALDDGALLHDVARGAGVTQDVDDLAHAILGIEKKPAKLQPRLLDRLMRRKEVT
jgi:pilus assembly protein CpaE